MPLCTICAHPADYLYTTYKTKSNIRLSVCPRCGNFLDPLIEHPPLLLLLDLILLKPRVYLHLLFNKGTRPFDTDHVVTESQQQVERSDRLRSDFTTLALLTVCAETLGRLQKTEHHGNVGFGDVPRVLVLVAGELAVQHAVTAGLALLALRWKGWYPAKDQGKESRHDGRQDYFSPIMIPLILLYTTFLPLALQLILSIWYTPDSSNVSIPFIRLPSIITQHVSGEILATVQDALQDAMTVWNQTDRIWAGTKLLGGMSAGFGLRVILPTRPWETTATVLAGWGAASLVGRVIASL